MTLIDQICRVCIEAQRPLCRTQIAERLPRRVDDNVLAVTIAQNLFTRLSRRPAGTRVREQYGARTVYWAKGSKPRKHFWTRAEKRALKLMYPHIRTEDVGRILGRDVGRVYAMAALLGLRKTKEFVASPLSGTIKRGERRGIGHEFKKGHVPWTKGVKGLRLSPATEFKRGEPSRRWDPEVYCVGALRINADGYIDMKVRTDRRGAQNWRALHVILWEDAHGPVPPKHIVIFKDGDRMNACLENLKCISQGDNLRRNSMWVRYPRPLAEAINALGQLKRRIRERSEHAA